MLKFAYDFQPDTWIEGGDNMDYGPVSHWLKTKKKSLEGLDLREDARVYRKEVLEPINTLMSRPSKQKKEKIWLKGNHEDWATQFGEENPGAASLVNPETLLDLHDWDVVEQGGYRRLGHLHVIHGDTLGGTNPAKQAVDKYGKSVMFGHFHTHQIAAKHEMLDVEQPKIGICVPGLTNKNPNYLKGKPNQWMKGFAYGYVMDDGQFQVYVPIILNGRFSAEGKVYRG
jgi:post-segregation antitoxin (ccd killing protein)